MRESIILLFILVPLVYGMSLIYPLNTHMSEKKYAMLCLGDSYTIGESVAEDERFPNQCVRLLRSEGIFFDKPQVIAKTGWTTDELSHAIHEAKLTDTYDCVTLLIGVNNQYRGYDKDMYRKEFGILLQTALRYARGEHDHVFVVSIPDWGATPFGANDAKGRSASQISKEIDEYNAINKEESLKMKVHYTDINPESKEAAKDASLIANDNLHPSGKMYSEWAKLLKKEIVKGFTK
jgi:lysophospholipase L1-like esterase